MFVRAIICAFVLAAAIASPASAAVWAWGCIGTLGADKVVYNRNSLTVEPANSSRVELRKLIHNEVELKTADGMRFEAEDGNSGFEKAMEFKRADGNGNQKLVLTETSSRKMSERKGRAGPRDETTTLFKKTYRYAFEGEADRKVAMDCIEYTLSTKGGRQ
jgi:hypothetical protein